MYLYHASIRLDEDLQRDSNGRIRMLPSAQLSEESFAELFHGSETHDCTYAGADIAMLGGFVLRHWKQQATRAIRLSGDESITVDLHIMFATNFHYWMFNQVVMPCGAVVFPCHANLCKCAGPFAPDIVIRFVFKNGNIDFLDSSDNVERTLLYAGGKTRREDRLDMTWEQAEKFLVVDDSGMGAYPGELCSAEAIEAQRVELL